MLITSFAKKKLDLPFFSFQNSQKFSKFVVFLKKIDVICEFKKLPDLRIEKKKRRMNCFFLLKKKMCTTKKVSLSLLFCWTIFSFDYLFFFLTI